MERFLALNKAAEADKSHRKEGEGQSKSILKTPSFYNHNVSFTSVPIGAFPLPSSAPVVGLFPHLIPNFLLR